MAVSKIELATGDVLIDLTADTVTPETLAEGYTAHGADGELIVGTMKATEDLNAVLAEQESLIAELQSTLKGKAAGSSGGVGGLSAYAKISVIPQSKNQFTIANPLGGFAKKVSIACPVGSAVETTAAMLQKYSIDATTGMGVMRYIHATNENLTHSGAYQVEPSTNVPNARFTIDDGKIIVRSYGSTNGIWDTTCEYEIEIWQ